MRAVITESISDYRPLQYARDRVEHYAHRTIFYLRMGYADEAAELARITHRWAVQAGLIIRED